MAKNVKYGLAYLFPIIAPLILLLAVKDNDQDDKEEIGQALVVQIGLIILGIVLGILKFIPILGTVFSIISSFIGLVHLGLAIFYFCNRTAKFPYAWDLGCKLVEKM